MLSKNLLFSTLGSQITKDFVWKSKAAIRSFTFNFVKLLYLIILDARTNLIRFYWNLHHIEHLIWISEQFLVHHNIPRSSGWILRSNNGRALQVEKTYPRDSGCSLLKMALCTLSSNISAPRQKKILKMPRMLRCSVLDDPLQNSSFHGTWLCQKKCIKIQCGEWDFRQ